MPLVLVLWVEAADYRAAEVVAHAEVNHVAHELSDNRQNSLDVSICKDSIVNDYYQRRARSQEHDAEAVNVSQPIHLFHKSSSDNENARNKHQKLRYH